ncbi:MAG: hypothetical protein MR687_10000 [Spirochaetales bacterium]|nr:hypothetical protein [Spirochaetales bacterium]
MKKVLLVVFLLFLISLSSCDISLSEEDSDVYTPEEVVTPISGLRPYTPVNLINACDEGREVELPEDIISSSDEGLLAYLEPSLSGFFKNGFLKAFFEGLRLDIDNIFSSSTLNPRSISTKAELHVTDEGVKIKKGYSNVAEALIKNLDVIAEGESLNFMKFLFNTLDSSEWPYSQKSANMSGSVGISTSLGVFDTGRAPDDTNVESAAFSMYLTVDLNNIKLGKISTKNSEGVVSSFYFPSYGTLKFRAEMSIAQSVLTTKNCSIDGYPTLNDDEITYKSYYAPNRIWLSVKESSEFDVREVYGIIKSMVTSSGSISNEALWNKLCNIIWKNQVSPYITMGVEIMTGEGETRTIVLKDYALLQFLF